MGFDPEFIARTEALAAMLRGAGYRLDRLDPDRRARVAVLARSVGIEPWSGQPWPSMPHGPYGDVTQLRWPPAHATEARAA